MLNITMIGTDVVSCVALVSLAVIVWRIVEIKEK